MGVVKSWKRVIPAPVFWIALLTATLFLLTRNWASTALMTVFLVVFSMTIGAQKLAAVRDHWRKLTATQKVQAVGIIGVIVVALWSIKAATTEAHQAIVLEQLRLPADTVFADFRSRYRGKGMKERIEAVVRFSDREFWEYVAKVDDAQPWQPVPFVFEKRTIAGSYDAEALRWEWTPRPAFAGAVRVRWGHVSREQENHSTKRRTLCFAAVPIPANTTAEAGASSTFQINACRHVPRTEYPLVYVLAALDYETKSLHVIFN